MEPKLTPAEAMAAAADWLEAVWNAQPERQKPSGEFQAGMDVAMEIHREGTLRILRQRSAELQGGG